MMPLSMSYSFWDIQRHTVNVVTLKTGLELFKVIENNAVRWTMYDFLLVDQCKYSFILCHFWVIWRWVISWSGNQGYRLLKVIQNGTIRKLVYGLLFAFHNNYGPILYHSRNKARYWSKSRFFHTSVFDTPVRASPSEYCRSVTYRMGKLEWFDYRMVKLRR